MRRTRFEEAALHAPDAPRPVLIDFDHTLFGGNSVELFIRHSRPAALVRVLDLLIRRCVPWRLAGRRRRFRLRDYALCRVLFLLPGNLDRWRDAAPALFEQRVNKDLAAALARVDDQDLAILTFSIEPIVTPMLRGARWETIRMLSTSATARLSEFGRGKLAMAEQAVGHAPLPRAMFVTDSMDDLDLLMAVGSPVLIEPFHAPGIET